ncbi:hypothetical protein FGG08_003517 [Glutinoglossum americanum]|uniref:Aldehyde dehydrogenase n=1 Tax=Glutinoglossum americanum TaxID=1670608 RepID=A0A9P8HY54_9PEZI|nr:hypothetical protein FGG08_003517 [Glutinoglossum americanum]
MASSTAIPTFSHTPIEAIPGIAVQARSTFRSQKTKPLEYRLTQLRKLWWGLKDNEAAIIEACRLDLGKPSYEAITGEVGWCLNDIIFVCNNLKKWMADEKAPDIDLKNSVVNPKIRKEPLGAVLVIGAFNYPFQLSLGPFIGAIAAGNTAVLKPSELSPNTAAVMQRIIQECLDSSAYFCIQGAVPETTELLSQKWDKIFYTGSSEVGILVAKKAAETLTPVTLELGGKNPAIISRFADTRLAARRLIWGKTLNAGQVCLSQNYILIDKEVLPSFVDELGIAFKEFYPNGAKASPDFARIVNERHFHRIKKMLDETHGKILIGGAMDEKEKFIEPTVVQVDSLEDSLIKEESFGPLFPLLPVDGLDEAIRIANEVDSTPLAMYPFSKKSEEIDRRMQPPSPCARLITLPSADAQRIVLNEITSGGASINDSFFHGSIPTLAFGGVGSSGQGSYRGKASFDAFTHRRSVTHTPSWLEKLISIRYPPYAGKISRYKRMVATQPDFDREGKVKGDMLAWVLTLGGGRVVAVRWLAVLLAAIGIKKVLESRTSKL